MAVSRPYRKKKIRHFPQDSFLGHFYLGNLIIDRKKKIPRFLVEEGWNGPKNGPKENKGKLKERKSPLLKKRKASNELAWGHCEKRYNTWLCQMTVYRPCRNQKNRHCSQDAFSGYFYLGDWIINRKKKKPDNGPKNGPKENKGKLEESKSPLLKKSKVLNELAWGHCEKRYNTWSCPIAVSRPCRNQKNRHFPQDAFSGYFYLGDWIIDRKKNKNSVIFGWAVSEMVQRTG